MTAQIDDLVVLVTYLRFDGVWARVLTDTLLGEVTVCHRTRSASPVKPIAKVNTGPLRLQACLLQIRGSLQLLCLHLQLLSRRQRVRCTRITSYSLLMAIGSSVDRQESMVFIMSHVWDKS